MNERQVRIAPAEFRTEARENGERHIRGYFVVFDDIYEVCPNGTESVDRHAFDGQLNGDIRMLIDHDSRLVLGRTTAGTMALGVDDHGLWADAILNEDDVDAKNVYARLERGDVSQASFGFNILDEETDYRADGSVHWTLKKVELFEVSVCTFPAYKATAVEARSEQAKQMSAQRRFDQWKSDMLNKLKEVREHGAETAHVEPAGDEPAQGNAEAD